MSKPTVSITVAIPAAEVLTSNQRLHWRAKAAKTSNYADEELFIARTCGRDDGTGPCDEVLVGDDRCPYHDENGEVE